MARFRAVRPYTSDAQPIIAVGWRPFLVPANWQVIGQYWQAPGNNVISYYAGPQRRNGVSDITSSLMPMYNPNWVNQFPVVVPGTQRQQQAPPQQGPSRYGVYKMRKAVTQAQVQASGAAIIPFTNNSENPLVAPANG